MTGKTSVTTQLQNKLTGALIGLARATDGNTSPTADTYSVLIEGLFTTITSVCFDDAAMEELIDKVHREKMKLVPQCGSCASPCGRNNDYEMDMLWDANEDVRALKLLILFGLRGMAAHAYHAAVLGYTDEEVNRFFAYALFMIGKDLTVEELLPTALKAGEVGLKCTALLDKAKEREDNNMPETCVMDCPCKMDCRRHGNCVECIAHHRKLGWPLVACMREMLDKRKNDTDKKQ